MRPSNLFIYRLIAILGSTLLYANVNAQLQIKDFGVFGFTGVQLGSSTQINGGKTGSNAMIQSSGTASFTSSLYSNGQINLTNSNTITGKVYVANTTSPSSPALQMGSNAVITDTGVINGTVAISSGTLTGPIFYKSSFNGPTPTKGSFTTGAPTIPSLPNLPYVLHPANTSTTDITTTKNIGPGTYRAMMLSGGQTITFTTPGVYIFDSIKNSGNSNKFVFTFKNAADRYRIYVRKNVDLYKINISATGNFNATNNQIAERVYMQVEGNGSTAGGYAWTMTSGASGSNQSSWFGTVYAPNGTIDIGNGSSQSKVLGALWSGKNVNIESGVSVSYVPYLDCSPTVDAGKDTTIDCDHPSVVLRGTSSGTGQQYIWTSSDGTVLSSGTSDSVVVNKAGTYFLTAYSLECMTPATDSVVVKGTRCVFPYYPPPITGKVFNKIGSELTSLSQNYGNVIDDGKTLFLLRPDSTVLIDVIVLNGNYGAVLSLLQSSTFGMTGFISNGVNSLIITGWIKVSKLDLFNVAPMSPLINYVRPSYPPVSNAGLIQSQGDTAMKSFYVRNGYHLSGDSIKVGVLSDSYNTLLQAARDVSNGDMPGGDTLEVVQDYPFGERTDEGRAMLQIVHDIAPNARLAFRTGFITAGDMAQGILELADRKCDVIVDDITFITEPFFRPGYIANAIRTVTQRGVNYVTAAGNFGVKSYEGNFTPASATIPPGTAGVAVHNFGGNNIFQTDSVKGSVANPSVYTIVLQWENNVYSLGGNPGASADLDLYAFDNLGYKIGFNRVNFDGDPIEVLTFVVTSNTVVNLMVVSDSLVSNVHFKYVVFRGDLKVNTFNQGFSTVVGQANSPDAITVGAAFYAFTPPYTGGIPNPAIFNRSSYSSVGGTIYSPDGTIALRAPAAKPDLIAPSGVNTSIEFGSIDYENDRKPNFFGTSAAAPHVAGAIALMAEARRKYYRDTLPTATIKNLLVTSALDMDASGFDNNTGYGFIRIDTAIQRMANPIPHIDGVRLVDSSLTVGAQPMQIIITGSYLTANTKVILNNDTLQSTILNSEITTTIPAFTDTGALYLFNQPKSQYKTDAGLSDVYYLNGIVKKNVVVTAVDTTRKYGETNPIFRVRITVDGIVYNKPLDSLGLGNLQITTEASPTSDIGNYAIRPSKVFDSAGVDHTWLIYYNYQFVTGNLNIGKMPLTITPNPITVNYGDAITNVTYNYQYDQTKVSSGINLLDTIKLYHKAFTPSNALAVLNGYKTLETNGTISASALDSLNMIASFQSLSNSRIYQVTNGKLAPVTSANAINQYYVIDVSANSIANYVNNLTNSFINAYPGISNKAVVSESKLVSGTAQVSGNSLINGSLVQMVSAFNNSYAPISNGQLVQLVSGQLVQLVSGVPQPIPNSSLVQLISGQLVQLVSNQWVPLPNSQTSSQLVQLVSGQLVQMVSSQLVQLVSGQPQAIPSASQIQEVNGQLVQLVSGQLVQLVSGQLVQLVSGQLVQMVSNQLAPIPSSSLVQMVSGSLVQLVSNQWVQIANSTGVAGTNNNTAVIVDQKDVTQQNGWLGSMIGVNMITGLEAGQQRLIPGVFINKNFDVKYHSGNVTINTIPITIKAKDSTKTFGSAMTFAGNEFTISSGTMQQGETIASVTLNSTGAAASAQPGSYPIVPSNAVGSSNTNMANYSITYANGTLTVGENPACILTHSKFANFGSTPNGYVSLWLNIEIKVSGQLRTLNDYILYSGGSITFNNINSNPAVTNVPVKRGIIKAANVPAPVSYFDVAQDMFITLVPVGFSSTSDIFISGVILSSTNGFSSNKSSTSTLKGAFYSSVNFSDQWNYAMAAYKTGAATFVTYQDLANPNGTIVPINGTNHAGTPLPWTRLIVSGGSGNGGTNYTGNSSSQDNFTACQAPTIGQYIVQATGRQASASIQNNTATLNVAPNPAANRAEVSFVPEVSGNTTLRLFNQLGVQVRDVYKGSVEAGQLYQKEINTSNLTNGVYLLHLQNGSKTIVQRLVILK